MEGLSEGEVAAVGEGSLDESIGDAEVLVAVRERGARHLDVELLERVRPRRVEVESHVVEPVEVLVGRDVALEEEANDVPLVDELRDEVLAFAALDRGELGEDGVGEDVQPAKDDGEGALERRAGLERSFDEARPADLHGEYDQLGGVKVDPGEELLRFESLGGVVEELEVGEGAGEGLSEGDLHLRLELREPIVDLREVLEDDRCRERDLLSLARRHPLDPRDILVELDRREPGEHLLEELADADDLRVGTRSAAAQRGRGSKRLASLLLPIISSKSSSPTK